MQNAQHIARTCADSARLNSAAASKTPFHCRFHLPDESTGFPATYSLLAAHCALGPVAPPQFAGEGMGVLQGHPPRLA